MIIVDKRASSDPNMQVQESYKIKSNSQKKEIIQVMLEYNSTFPVSPAWTRTDDSMLNEWKYHNFSYNIGVKRSRTADCDFNNCDENVGFWDFVEKGVS